MHVFRSPVNPILIPAEVKPTRPDFEVICVINAGVARYKDEVILLLRVVERPKNEDPNVYLSPVYNADQGNISLLSFPRNRPDFDFSDPRIIATPEEKYLTALSHLRLARGQDGIHFHVEDSPALFPETPYETYGIEDPRITKIGEDYFIQYVGVSSMGIVTALARTSDFVSFERLGIIFPPDNKDVAIFPTKIHGKYYALHRPSLSAFGKPEIWIAESPDLICWGNHQRLISQRTDGWENGRIGASAVPFQIEQGWVEIYHGANRANRYCLGALLLDKDKPWKVLARTQEPIMEPVMPYEQDGFFPNVIFTCGALYEDGKVKIYYGAADTCMAYAELSLEQILSSLCG